jgi:hypothetical protein
MIKAIIVILFLFGISLVLAGYNQITNSSQELVQTKIDQEPNIVYRYIPRTFEEEQLDPISVTDIFQTMFSQPSPWVGSIRNYDRRKQEKINKYFVNQL